MPTPAYSAHALTTVAAANYELGLTSDGGTVDAYICSLINRVSDRIANYCNRTFEYGAAISESVPGYGTAYLVLARAPITAITSITYNGNLVDSTYYAIGTAGAGTVYSKNGYTWTASRDCTITQDPVPGSENPLYVVVYSGGYVTQPQLDLATVIAPLVRTLPYDLEDACLQMVTSRYLAKGQDQRIKSERLMSASQEYWDVQLSPDVAAVLNNYRMEPIA